MTKFEWIFVIIIIVAFVIVFSSLYIFNIYEIDLKVNRTKIYADGQSLVKIETIPINGLGFKTPFRKSFTKFEITEGKGLIDIIKKDERNGIIILKAKYETGKVVIIAKAKHSLFPSIIEVEILPNLT